MRNILMFLSGLGLLALLANLKKVNSLIGLATTANQIVQRFK
ncbi:hypothetical protein SAMN04487985_10626 [Aerococcus urinaehominis]|nr:hypothetical protein [Aerococcus urinaehominis]SDM12936.1 hypothetical protein SAMN04487985_10626 [Aerococcus urinaehominis]